MRITFTRKGRRTQLVCQRKDGTTEIASLGPQVPHHDLGHYVVEQKLGLKNGFFGHVQQGYSVNELSRKEVIVSLDVEVWQAEILTRALGSIATGACTVDQFPELVNAELKQFNWPTVDNLSTKVIEEMHEEFEALIKQFKRLEDGGSMSLDFVWV